MSRSDPKLSQFGPAFAWLLEKEVSSCRIADLFGTTAENVRVIAFRARHPEWKPEPDEEHLDDSVRPGTAAILGIRAGPDDVVRTPARSRKLDRLILEIECAVAPHTQNYTFLDGVRALRKFAQRIGYAGDARASAFGRSCTARRFLFISR